jgi:hypothetical protein
MIARRHLLGTTLFRGLLGATTLPAEGEYGQLSDPRAQEIVDGLKEIRRAIESQRQPNNAEIVGLRQRQMDFLRTSGKFPDFIEAGSDVWFGVYDWHVRHLQPLTLGRDPTGRYTILLMSTVVILRPDSSPTFVGNPYDNR